MIPSVKQKKKPGGRFLRMFILVALILTALFIYLETNITQVILDKSYADAYALAAEVLNKAAAEMMGTGITYEDLMTVTYDQSGRIALLQANTIRMNELAAATALSAQNMLKQQDNKYVTIPLGAALGMTPFAAAGPKISVQIIPVGAVSTKFSTDFETAGINQTRHRILLTVMASVRLVIPTGAMRVDVSTQLSVAESIIVGEVPQSFMDLNGHTELLPLVP